MISKKHNFYSTLNTQNPKNWASIPKDKSVEGEKLFFYMEMAFPILTNGWVRLWLEFYFIAINKIKKNAKQKTQEGNLRLGQFAY